MNKELLINAVMGKGYYDLDTSGLEKAKLLRYTGDQWNEDWDWNREELEKLSAETLEKIYNRELYAYVKPERYPAPAHAIPPLLSLEEWWDKALDDRIFEVLTGTGI